MSVPPDYINQLLSGQNGLYSPTMGLAMGLLQAGGPSRMPVSLGQALGQGLQTGQQFQQAGLQNAMQQLMLGRTGLQMNMLRDALGQAQPDQFQAAPQPSGPVVPASPQVDMGSPGLLTGAQPVQSNAPPAAPPTALPARIDPYQDSVYIHNQKMAQALDMLQPGSGAGYAAAAQQRLDFLNKEGVNLTPEQAKLLIPGGTVPGQTLLYHPSLGTFDTVGTEALKPTSVFSPQLGTMVPTLTDVRKGTTGSNVPDLSPDKPLPGVMESKAQAIYAGNAPPLNESRGDPGADATMARVRYLAQQNGDTYDASTWQQKQQAVKSFGTGKMGQQVASANKAVLHLDTLSDLANNLNNTQAPAFNHLANMWKAQTGQSAPTSFEAARQVALDEVNKFIVGSSGGVSDREKMQSIISKASSPQQLADGIKTIKELMGGQLYALQKQYEASTGLHDFQKRYLFPQTQDLLQTIQSPEGGQQATGAKVMNYNPQTGKIE